MGTAHHSHVWQKDPSPTSFPVDGTPPAPKSYSGGTAIVGSLYGGTIKPIDWTPAAFAIKEKVEAATGETFDSLNINLYRDNKDYVGWHVDKQDEGLWTAPIASVAWVQSAHFKFGKEEARSIRCRLHTAASSLCPRDFSRDGCTAWRRPRGRVDRVSILRFGAFRNSNTRTRKRSEERRQMP